MTSRLVTTIRHVLFSALVATPMVAAAEQSIHRNLDAEILGDHLLLLRSDKGIQVWDLLSSKFDFDRTQKLSSKAMEIIAVADGQLWGLNKSKVFQWDQNEERWLSKYDLGWFEKGPLSLVIVDGEPYVIFEEMIIRLSNLEGFTVPLIRNDPGKFFGGHLRPLEIKVIGSRIWIGNGWGEFGGNLVSFDTSTATWNSKEDRGYYVTGISQVSQDRLAVSWSMSHLGMKHAVLRIHASNTSVVKEFEGFPPRGKYLEEAGYLQKIVYDKRSGEIYAIEQNDLVRLANGQPEKIADLGPLLYRREPGAIGVVPGVFAMFSTESGGIIVVHRDVAPFVFKDGVLNQLKQ